MRFYTASKLGSKRALTPEGFLVCLDVPIARTGEMLYAPQELPGMTPGPDGLIRVQRYPADVFKPESLASFVGKPTTNDHPPVQVTPANYRIYSTGSTQNVRPGAGSQADLVLADLIFAEPGAIAAIDGGKDEISNGYDAEYEEIAPGVYRQLNIIGNHVALVDAGRCGERCAIGDSAAALQATPAAASIVEARNAAGIALRNGAGQFLFLKRAGTGDQPGTWCFPGGGIEGDETPEAAARRELREETGLTAGPLAIVSERNFVGLAAPEAAATFTTFVGDVSGSATPVLNDEHDAFHWATLEASPQPLHPGVAATIAEKRSAFDQPITPAAVPATNEAPSCGCGGHHNHDASPARAKRRKIRDMATKKLSRSAFDRIRRAFATKDEEAFEAELSTAQEAIEESQEAVEQREAEEKFAAMITTAVGAAVTPLSERLDTIEAKVAAAPAAATEDGDENETEEQKAAKAAAAKAEALTTFLKSKGLSDEDIVAACKAATDSAPADMGTGETQAAEGGGPENQGGGANSSPVYDEESAEEIEKAKKTTSDAANYGAVFRAAVARAEMLAPGVKLPTYDGKAMKKTMADAVCALQRATLKKAFAGDQKAHVAPFVTDAAPDFDKMSCGAVRLIFAGASELAKVSNNTSARTADAITRDNTVRGSITDMNSRAKALWKK